MFALISLAVLAACVCAFLFSPRAFRRGSDLVLVTRIVCVIVGSIAGLAALGSGMDLVAPRSSTPRPNAVVAKAAEPERAYSPAERLSIRDSGRVDEMTVRRAESLLARVVPMYGSTPETIVDSTCDAIDALRSAGIRESALDILESVNRWGGNSGGLVYRARCERYVEYRLRGKYHSEAFEIAFSSRD